MEVQLGLSEHIEHAELAMPLTFRTTAEPISGELREVTIRRVNGEVVDIRIVVEFAAEEWALIDRQRLFHLEPSVRGPGAEGFQPEGPLRIEVRLNPGPRAALVAGSGAHPTAIAERLAGATTTEADLLADESSWRATTVTVALDLPPDLAALGNARVGFRTLWDEHDDPMAIVVRRVLDDHGWSYVKLTAENGFGWRMESEHGGWESFALTLEEEQRFAVYSQLDLVLPADQVPAAALLVARVNYGLPVGNWELDVDDGSLRFKTSIDLAGTSLTPAVAAHVVDHNLVMVDRYLEAFAGFAEGRLDVEAAIHLAEG
jgi:hypothetical protein